MLKKTFAKLHEAFEAMTEEVKEAVASADVVAIESQGIEVEIKDGNVTITGPLKQLTINGKRVRFTTTRTEYQTEEPPKDGN